MLNITGVLEISRVEELRPQLLALLEMPAPSLDLGGLTGCDTAGLQLLLAARRSAASDGKALALVNPPACLARLANTLGLASAFPEVQV